MLFPGNQDMSEEELEQIDNLKSSKSSAPDGTPKISEGAYYEIADLQQKYAFLN